MRVSKVERRYCCFCNWGLVAGVLTMMALCFGISFRNSKAAVPTQDPQRARFMNLTSPVLKARESQSVSFSERAPHPHRPESRRTGDPWGLGALRPRARLLSVVSFQLASIEQPTSQIPLHSTGADQHPLSFMSSLMVTAGPCNIPRRDF